MKNAQTVGSQANGLSQISEGWSVIDEARIEFAQPW